MLYSEAKWLEVPEIAKLLSLSPEMIYKLLQKGELPALKIGSSWRISKQEFENWLSSKKSSRPQNPKTLSLAPLAQQVLMDFKKQLQSHYGKNWVALYVYGSWARGTANTESDLDLLIILKNFKKRLKEKQFISKAAYDCSFKQGREIVLSTLVITETEFAKRQDPLICRIREEGKLAA